MPSTTAGQSASPTFSSGSVPAEKGSLSIPLLSKQRLRGYAWFVVSWNVLVILWGAIVRATGSGAGCGNHWPLCNGEVIPHSPRVATLIEFTHRAMTGGATITILLLLAWTFRATPARHWARMTAVASTLLLINEAFLGALLVKLGYVVNDQSLGRFIILPIHLANTMLLLAALTLTAHFLSREAGFMRGSVEFPQLFIGIAGLSATIVVGITGSLAALGDTLFPAATFAQDFSASSPWILRLRWLHPAASLVAGAVIVFALFFGGILRSSRSRSLGKTILLLVGLQFVLGGLDVLLHAPAWLQIVHLLGADVLWVALVVMCARWTVVPLGCTERAGALGVCSLAKRRMA